MRLIDVEYNSNSEPFSVTCEEECDGTVYVFESVLHGRWEEVRENAIFGKRLRCSNCKSEQGLMIRFNYCFNCGARMGAKED